MANEVTKKDLNSLKKDIRKDIYDYKEEVKRHSVVLYEKFRGDVKIITEGMVTKEEAKQFATKEDLKAVKEKTDATFEMVGKIVEDNAEFKKEYKKKVDRAEFDGLETRVTSLEKSK
jgi:tRNA C32,U32 (ribose-2'-O)-methylase TrmJ